MLSILYISVKNIAIVYVEFTNSFLSFHSQIFTSKINKHTETFLGRGGVTHKSKKCQSGSKIKSFE